MKKSSKFNVGDYVVYTAYEGAAPETGVVSSTRDNDDGTQKVWVRYRIGGSGQLTPVNRLKHQ
jgi:hypothetical protein